MNARSQSALFLTPLVLWSTLAQADLAKVAAYLNKGSSTAVVEVRNGALVAPEAFSKNIPGHYIEDCRKGALRQAILDASAAGNSSIELSRKYSHRMKITSRPEATTDKDVGTLVGVRLITNGTVKEMTFSYLMDDPADGDCSIVAIDAPVAKVISRKDQEKLVQTEILPKLSAERLNFLRSSYSKDGKPASDEQIAKKSVGGLIDWECEQYSINQALELSRRAYAAKYPGAQPIILLDYANSKLTSAVTEANRKADLTTLNGSWALRLSDATGTKTLATKVSFELNENEKSCTGTVNPQVETAP